MVVIKLIKYLIQAIVIYLLFITIKIIGLNFSRKIFASLFNKIGPLVKSEKIINDNLEKFLGTKNIDLKKKIKKKNVEQLWKNFCRILVLK